MPEPDKIAVVVQEWITKAENDLKNATHTLKLGRVRREIRRLLEGESLLEDSAQMRFCARVFSL